MTLVRSITLRFLGLTAGLALLGAISLWGLASLQDRMRQVREGYEELRLVQNATEHAVAAKNRHDNFDAEDPVALEELEARDDLLDAFLELQRVQDRREAVHRALDRAVAMQAFDDLREALKPSDTADKGAPLNFQRILADLDVIAQHMDTEIGMAQADASDQLWLVTVVIVGLTGLLLITALWLNVAHYRSVVAPLRQLGEGARRLAKGNFRSAVEIGGVEEFVQLANDFNHMAKELDGFYRQLEEKVRQKSNELVRSERLASVGFLGAGVAHEINNPLGVISGHAELLLRRLDKAGLDNAEAGNALRIIRDEAFRCREIIQKLIALARPGEMTPGPVSLPRIARDVVAMVSCLNQSRQREILVDIPNTRDLVVRGSETELKQVLLNLVVNALEAVPPGGKVHLATSRHDGWVDVLVRDNGRGMTEEALEHAFEPFYSERPAGQRGLGLGLSISNAIIESHGGRISANSDGPNRGSCFTVHLPAIQSEHEHERDATQAA